MTAKLERAQADLRSATAERRRSEPGEDAARLRLDSANRAAESANCSSSSTRAGATRIAGRRHCGTGPGSGGSTGLAAARRGRCGARADAASQNVQRFAGIGRDRRAAADRRLELLLGALEGAASGLRREWDLIGGGP